MKKYRERCGGYQWMAALGEDQALHHHSCSVCYNLMDHLTKTCTRTQPTHTHTHTHTQTHYEHTHTIKQVSHKFLNIPNKPHSVILHLEAHNTTRTYINGCQESCLVIWVWEAIVWGSLWTLVEMDGVPC